MCLGESTTAVGGNSAYPVQLENVLNDSNIGVKFAVINRGVTGTNSELILQELSRNIDKYNPHMVVVMMGINDWNLCFSAGKAFSLKVKNFLKSFRVYKLIKLLKGCISSRINKTKMHNLEIRDSDAGAFPENEELFKNNITKNPSDFGSYIKLGQVYTLQDKQNEIEILIKKYIKFNPDDYRGYDILAWFYKRNNKFIQAEESFLKAIELGHEVDVPYIDLGSFYMYQNRFDEAKKMFQKAVKLNPNNSYAYSGEGWCYLNEKEYSQAEEAFIKAIKLNPGNAKAYASLGNLYTETGKYKIAGIYSKRAKELRVVSRNPATYSNYLELKEILDKRNIKLVCVQYPMRSSGSLKNIFIGQERVIFVDNEKIFYDAVKKNGYREYFSDNFAGDFGHCTPKGNRLLAENIANVILKECFSK